MIIHPVNIAGRVPQGKTDLGVPGGITGKKLIGKSLSHPGDAAEIKDHLFKGFQSGGQTLGFGARNRIVGKEVFKRDQGFGISGRWE